MPKEKETCPKCKEIRYMTRHHVKDNHGKKTGEIEIMCRDCHDDVEEEYQKRGIVPSAVKKLKNQKIVYFPTGSINDVIPFYATKQASEKRLGTI